MSRHSVGRIYAEVLRIPYGRVSTYGRIAARLDGVTARMVGYALAALPDDLDVPWHRVVNARGEVSLRSTGDGAVEQRHRLEAEGVGFDAQHRIRLADALWNEHAAGDGTPV